MTRVDIFRTFETGSRSSFTFIAAAGFVSPIYPGSQAQVSVCILNNSK